MEQQNSFLASLRNVIGMSLSGIGLGWLIGMSESPIIQTIILSFLSFFVGVMGILSGTKLLQAKDTLDTEENDSPTQKASKSFSFPQVNMLPIGFFMVFLVCGEAAGVYARINLLLIDIDDEKRRMYLDQKWSKIVPNDSIIIQQYEGGEIKKSL